MYPVQNSHPLVLHNNFITNTPKNNNKAIEQIKNKLKLGLSILETNNSLDKVTATHKKNITSLLKLLDSNKIINSDISITGKYDNIDERPKEKNINQLKTYGFTISYNDKKLMKTMFIEKTYDYPLRNSCEIEIDFSIECYDEFYKLCSDTGISSYSSNPTLSTDPDYFLDRNDFRKTKQQHTEDFDKEFSERLVNKSYSNTNRLIPTTTTEKNHSITKAHTISERPVAVSRPAIIKRPVAVSRPTTKRPSVRKPITAVSKVIDKSIIKEQLVPNTNINW